MGFGDLADGSTTVGLEDSVQRVGGVHVVEVVFESGVVARLAIGIRRGALFRMVRSLGIDEGVSVAFRIGLFQAFDGAVVQGADGLEGMPFWTT